jgi:enoyl-CoA hydratase
MTPAFFPALRDAVAALNAEGRTRVLVIASTGKHFSAGMALDVFASAPARSWTPTRAPPPGLPGPPAPADALLRRDRGGALPGHCRDPGWLRGRCAGPGRACDLRVCSADAFFTVQEIHIGMAADLGVLQRLPKIVPPGVAREMAYTGDRVGAERALAVGLVNAVLPDPPGCWPTR